MGEVTRRAQRTAALAILIFVPTTGLDSLQYCAQFEGATDDGLLCSVAEAKKNFEDLCLASCQAEGSSNRDLAFCHQLQLGVEFKVRQSIQDLRRFFTLLLKYQMLVALVVSIPVQDGYQWGQLR